MDTREYFEKVMQDYNQNRKGRSLRKYCKDEAVDYNWLMEYKKTYRPIKTQTNAGKNLSEGEFIALTVEENLVSEQPTCVMAVMVCRRLFVQKWSMILIVMMKRSFFTQRIVTR